MNIMQRAVAVVKGFLSVPVYGANGPQWWWPIQESFAGAWQRNIAILPKEDLVAFSAVYACVSLIADDISKLRIKLLRFVNDIWTEDNKSTAFLPVLRKPNKYQTRIQFLSAWIVSKLLYGNTYVLKERDARKVVTALYVLDPKRVTPLITEVGDVYYRICVDYLSGVTKEFTAPASEIIHDRMLCLWHPLVGISPIVACGTSATQGLKIQSNSSKFFANMSRPSGHLTAPGEIPDATAKRLKAEFEKNFSAENIGRLLVTGDGLEYKPLALPPEAMQLIEQLKWTVEDVARCFKVPMYKLGLGQPSLNTIGALNQEYYTQTLQTMIESVELLLDEGLALPADLGTELDLEGLLRMDPLSRAERNFKGIGAGYLAPDEARRSENLPPVKGGDTPYMQQQNYSLAALADRDANGPAPASVPPSASPSKQYEDDGDEVVADFVKDLITQIREAAHAD